MKDADETGTKLHYICQTYVVQNAGSAKPSTLKVDKQIQYTTATQAQERAEREGRSDNCAGADAYMLSEDLNTGEVSAPTFLVRVGNVPEDETF